MGVIQYGKSAIRKAFMKIGVDIHEYSPASSVVAQLVSSLRKFEIDLVLDVGANYGQFASGIRDGGYSGRIVSFEPLSIAHTKLMKVSSNDRNWEIYSRCALGDREDEITINISGNLVSSSILPILASHLRAAPDSVYVGQETAPQLMLDSVLPIYLQFFKKPFLKIDTQGFEWQVLNGASDVLPSIRGVLLELSLIPLYEGQYLWQEMIHRMNQAGFTLWAIQPGFVDPSDGRTLQLDGIFYRIE